MSVTTLCEGERLALSVALGVEVASSVERSNGLLEISLANMVRRFGSPNWREAIKPAIKAGLIWPFDYARRYCIRLA